LSNFYILSLAFSATIKLYNPTHNMKKFIISISVFALFLTGCSSLLGEVDDPVETVAPNLASIMNLSVVEPATVLVGETYEVTVVLENTDDVSHLLTSIDIGDTYLAGSTLEGSNPAYLEEWDFSDYGFQSYDYQMNLTPGKALTIVYSFVAETSGLYEGSLDVCIDTEVDCLYNPLSTEIQ
jgi:hypothetical protein